MDQPSSMPDPGRPAASETAAPDQRRRGGELHQAAQRQHPPLVTNQGLPASDNQNSLRANPGGPTLLEDFIRDLPASPARGGRQFLKSAGVTPDAGGITAHALPAFISAAKTPQWDREAALRMPTQITPNLPAPGGFRLCE